MNKSSILKKVVVILFVSVLVLAACQPQGASPEGVIWKLDELNGNILLPNTNIVLNFDGNRLSGNDGCNSFGGSYTLKGNNLTIGEDLMSTMMACDESIMQQAGNFTNALMNTKKYKVVNDRLQLLDKEGKVMAVFSVQSQELAGTSWNVTSIYSEANDAIVSNQDSEEAKQTISFDTEGKINGNAGCNTFMGTYNVKDGKLSFGETATTRMMCAEETMKAESDFLAALNNAASYRITGNSLQILAENGNTLMTLIQAQ